MLSHFQLIRFLGEISSMSLIEGADRVVRVFVEIDGDQIEVMSASNAKGRNDPPLFSAKVSREQIAKFLPTRKKE